MNTITFVGAKEWMPPFSLDFTDRPKKLSDKEFFRLCQNNRDLRIERTKFGGIEIMAPAFTETGHQNFKLNAKFGVWVEKDGTGIGFDSSAGFTLPNGAVRSPGCCIRPRQTRTIRRPWVPHPAWGRLRDTHSRAGCSRRRGTRAPY